MAYVGITCDRSKQDGVPYVSRSVCDTCVQTYSHPCPFHGKMLKHMWRDGDNEPSAGAYSATRVQGCSRKRWFVAHSDTYEEVLDPYKAYSAMRGHFVHNFFENIPVAPGIIRDITEERFKTTIETKYGPKIFQGKPDLIEVKYQDATKVVVKVVDWKSIKEVKHDFLEAKETHQLQVNMYGWLLWRELPKYLERNIDVIVDEYEIVYMDMSKPRRFTSKSSLVDRGKLLTPRRAKNYEPIELVQLKHAEMQRMEEWIRHAIEDAIEAEETIFPPLEGDDAKICDWCSFQPACVAKWDTEGV